MKNGLILLSVVAAIFSAGKAQAEPLMCSNGRTNVWGENVRTGKAFHSNLAKAQADAYANFVNNLGSLGRDCFEVTGGTLEFGPIQSFSGKQSANEFWASWVVSIACCK
jgi:hypothetical protein